jgi:hypothetical protein
MDTSVDFGTKVGAVGIAAQMTKLKQLCVELPGSTHTWQSMDPTLLQLTGLTASTLLQLSSAYGSWIAWRNKVCCGMCMTVL